MVRVDVPKFLIHNKIQNKKQLSYIVKKHTTHGLCETINPRSPCVENGICTVQYHRKCLEETQTRQDGCPLYRRWSARDGGSQRT